MKKILIVNADDANLTPGVTEAILDCHDQGIVTSTTWMVNMANDPKWIREIHKRKTLGVGLHLNITRGFPVSPIDDVQSLVVEDGEFSSFPLDATRLPRPAEVALEYRNQIESFEKQFGRLPTHLDTHHQLHDHPFFYQILTAIAREYHLPVRRSALMRIPRYRPASVQSTEYLYGNLKPSGHWQWPALENILKNLSEGISEIICHPGKNDHALQRVSSFTRGREIEYRIFQCAQTKQMLEENEIILSHYGRCFR